MLAKRRFLFSIFFVLLSLLVEQLSVAATSKKGVVQGTREANLRVGPGVEHGVKGIVKENEQVTVEGQEGDWYLVETAAGQRGYLHKNFIKFVGEEQAGTVVVTEPKTVRSAADESKDLNKAPATDTSTTEQRSPLPVPPQKITQPALPPASPNQPAGATRKTDERRTSNNKAPSLIELLEGREGDMMLWAGIAIVFFLIGWIFGGHYYLRRDRARRTRLRF
jgi:Bacterial SH3 domain